MERNDPTYYQAERYRPQSVEGNNGSVENSYVRKTFTIVEKSFSSQVRSDDASERTANLAGKFTYKTGKYAALAGKAVAGGIATTAAAAAAFSGNPNNPDMTKKDVIKKKAFSGIKNSSQRIQKIIKQEAAEVVKDFRGSDDLGSQAVVKTKNAIIQTRNAAKTAKAVQKTTTRTVKTTAKTTVRSIKAAVRLAKKTVEVTVKLVKAVVELIQQLVAAIAANPVVLLVVVIILIVIVVISAICSILPATTLKSADIDLMEAYLYVTELDARYVKTLRELSTKSYDREIVAFHYIDESNTEIDQGSITVYTDADMVLMYLDAKYEDYKFDSDIKKEIDDLHAALHSYRMQWSTAESGYANEAAGTHMYIYIGSLSVDQYLANNRDTLLTTAQQELFDVLAEVGCYTTKTELSNPFASTNDGTYTVNSRWGWRYHPITGILHTHNGIDIPQPNGTPVNNIIAGLVIDVGYDEGGWGNYVRVQNDAATKDVVYAHLSAVNVSIDDIIPQGHVIGYVGATGAATGPHLHIEYTIDKGFFNGGGYKTNAAFYLNGYKGINR